MFEIFEQPWALSIAALIVYVAIWIVKAVKPNSIRRAHWLIPAAILILGLSLDMFVKTDREKIKTTLKKVVKAVEKENSTALTSLVSEDYRDKFHPSKKRLISHFDKFFSGPFIKKMVLRIPTININDGKTTTTFTVNITFEKDSFAAEYKQFMFVKCQLELKKHLDKKWYLTNGEILEIDKHPFSWKMIPY